MFCSSVAASLHGIKETSLLTIRAHIVKIDERAKISTETCHEIIVRELKASGFHKKKLAHTLVQSHISGVNSIDGTIALYAGS